MVIIMFWVGVIMDKRWDRVVKPEEYYDGGFW